MKLLKTPILFAVALTAIHLNAQTNSTPDSTSSTPKQNIFNPSVNYVSRLNYLGRIDSLHSSGLLPILGFESKIGLYANATFIFTQNSIQPLTYAGTSVEGGYKFPESKNFSGEVSYTQFFYQQTGTIVQSALKEQAGVNLTWKNDIVNFTAGGDLKFSNQTDIAISGALDHLFIEKIHSSKKMAVAFDPTATINAGTQKFIEPYTEKTTGSSGLLGGLAGQQTINQQVNNFNILSYEFSMPIVLVVNKFYAALTPAYVLPENLITVPNRPDLSEKGSDLFYVTATVGMRLGFR